MVCCCGQGERSSRIHSRSGAGQVLLATCLNTPLASDVRADGSKAQPSQPELTSDSHKAAPKLPRICWGGGRGKRIHNQSRRRPQAPSGEPPKK